MKLKKPSLVPLLSLSAAVAFAVLGIFFGDGPSKTQIAFLLAISGVVVAFFVEYMNLAEKVDDNISLSTKLHREVSNAIQNQAAVFFIGDHNLAFKELGDRFSRAVTISNIYVPYALRRDISYALLEPERLKNITNFIKNNPKNKYIEIISQESFFSKGDDYLKEISKSNNHNNFDLLVLNRSMPILNFVIFKYEDGTSEVLFGWGGFETTESTPVFATKEIRIVSVYSQIFQTMRNISSYPSHHNSIVGRIKEYVGFWIDISCGNDGKIENWAIIEFYLEGKSQGVGDDKRVALRGWAFKVEDNQNPTEILVRDFSSNSCEIRGSQIFVSHEARDPLSAGPEHRAIGQSIYDFSRLAQTGLMYGKIFSISIPNFSDQVISTISKKVDPELRDFLGKPEISLQEKVKKCKKEVKNLICMWDGKGK